jgi:hypothetical protein
VNIKSTLSPRRFALALQAATLVLAASACSPAARAQIKPEVSQLLNRFYNTEEFEPKTFGPARWLENGDAYTTVELSATAEDAREILRYATATGERSRWSAPRS